MPRKKVSVTNTCLCLDSFGKAPKKHKKKSKKERDVEPEEVPDVDEEPVEEEGMALRGVPRDSHVLAPKKKKKKSKKERDEDELDDGRYELWQFLELTIAQNPFLHQHQLKMFQSMKADGMVSQPVIAIT